jgi:hypothetical protein
MPKVKYTGTSNFREIKKADWTSVDVGDQGAVLWARDRLHTRPGAKLVNEISDAAWAFLQETEAADFEVVEETPPADTSESGDTGAAETLSGVTPPTRKVKDAPQA